jgi:hypothetical protein
VQGDVNGITNYYYVHDTLIYFDRNQGSWYFYWYWYYSPPSWVWTDNLSYVGFTCPAAGDYSLYMYTYDAYTGYWNYFYILIHCRGLTVSTSYNYQCKDYVLD